jgi:hypothetical protein
MSNVDGGGIPGLAGAAGGTAGVAAPVGGCDALADADAWGVGAADMLYGDNTEKRMRRAREVLSAPAWDDASGGRAGLQAAGLLIGIERCAVQRGIQPCQALGRSPDNESTLFSRVARSAAGDATTEAGRRRMVLVVVT